MIKKDIYYRYSVYLKKTYGEKVYKLPINLPVSCPNKEDNGYGCTYCAEKGAGFESQPSTFLVVDQLNKNKEYISEKFKANKFIAYFQNYTNTYLPLTKFAKYMNECLIDGVVEIAVSTRPDCINSEYLDILNEVKKSNDVKITIELGLQSTNPHTLNKINRGHTLAEYIDAVLLIKKYDFKICTHLILNLPYDDITDSIESAKIISALKIDFVKIHSLYLAKNTKMAEDYMQGMFELCSVDEYKARVVSFLEHLSPDIVIERLFARTHKEESLFSNWGISWWKIRDDIEKYMIDNNIYQGDKFNYLNGKALSKFN